MSRILVTPEMLLHVAQQCSRAHEQLEAMIHMLNQNIHMLESAWEGTTRSRFYADFQQAHREMTLTTEHIHRTSLELRGIAQRFKSADERVQPIQVAGHVLGAFPMMRGPAGHSAVEDAGRKAEEAWNAVQQEAGKAWDTVKQEAGELWEGVQIGAAQLGNSLKDTAISLYEDPLGTGKEMLYNATIGTVEDIWDAGIWAGKMLFSNEYREKVTEDVKAEVDSAGGWSNYLGQGAALILGEVIFNRAGIRGRGPLNNKHDDLGGGNSGGSGGNGSGDGDGKKSGDEGTPKAENNVAIENAKKITHFDNPADPFRDAFGAGSKSHPEEWNKLIKDMEDSGVEVVYREGAMGYGPLRKGEPGQILIDPDASMSALRHEYSHYTEAKSNGFPSAAESYQDWEGRIADELKAYTIEIEEAKRLGLDNIAEQLQKNFEAEKQYILDRYGPITE